MICGLSVHSASPTETGSLDPSRRSSILGTPLAPYACGRVYTAHPLRSSVAETDASRQTRGAQSISICTWLQLVYKDQPALLENAPFSTLCARKRYRVVRHFRQY